MTYPVAFGGGAKDYKTRGIPHSWLVGPDGKVVWKGHPASLNNSIIDKHIVGARIGPKIQIPDEFSKAQGYAKNGAFGKAYSDLTKQANRAKTPELKKAANDAMKSIEDYGDKRFAAIEKMKAARRYVDGIGALQREIAAFKGMDIGKKFESELKAWKKDKKIQAEISGSEMLAEAETLVKRGKYKSAAKIYAQLSKAKKFDGTEAQKEAEIRYQEIQKYL